MQTPKNFKLFVDKFKKKFPIITSEDAIKIAFYQEVKSFKPGFEDEFLLNVFKRVIKNKCFN